MKGIRRVGAVIIFAPLAACMVGEGDEPRVVSADEPLPMDVVAGDVIRREGLEVVVPEPGEEVFMVADMEDGSSIELSIRNPLGGAVEVIQPEMNEPDRLVIAAGAPGACDDGAFSLMGHKWTSQFQWKFQSGSTPRANSVANVEQALRNGANAITMSRNSCGLADLVSATNSYKGRTTAAPAVRNNNGTITCGNTDGTSSVGFGDLPSGTLGIACVWTSGGAAIEGDIRLTSRRAWFALGVPSGCSNKVGVQGVVTHEFGHVFGLGHVSESAHPNLTMSTAAGSCTNAELTLGLGDVRGLRRLY